MVGLYRSLHAVLMAGCVPQMSYNNYLDADAAYSAVCDLPNAGCVIVKHTNPCGAAERDDLLEAYRLAVQADPISAFGGIVAFNRWALHSLLCTMYLFLSPPPFPAPGVIFFPPNLIIKLDVHCHNHPGSSGTSG
jgi:AICARFT/IMPCHase bienzyme